MTTINNLTEHLALPLPHPDNNLEVDVARLALALQMLDGAVHNLEAAPSSQSSLATQATIGSSAALDVATTGVFNLTLTQPTAALSFVNDVRTDGVARQLVIILKQGTGNNLVTWPANVRWPNGRAPVLAYDANQEDIITLLSSGFGDHWYGGLAGGWYSA